MQKNDTNTDIDVTELFLISAYKGTRMIRKIDNNDGKFNDESYTSLCPAVLLSELGYKNIVCICTEKNKVVSDLFSNEEIPSLINDSIIDFIKPDRELKEMGVDFYTISGNGLEEVYNHGYVQGMNYIQEKLQ